MGEENMPKRIQRQRSKGWKMPPNSLYVGRPSALGNPFIMEFLNREESLELYRDAVLGFWSSRPVERLSDAQLHEVYLAAEKFKKRLRMYHSTVEFLKGYDFLACWCPLFDKDGNKVSCHADVLLEIANAVQSTTLNGDSK